MAFMVSFSSCRLLSVRAGTEVQFRRGEDVRALRKGAV